MIKHGHRALSFNGTTSVVDMGSQRNLQFRNGECSVLALVRGASAGGEGGFGYIYARTANLAATGLKLYVAHNAGSPQLAFGSSSGNTGPTRQESSGLFTYGKWLWVAATWTGAIAASSINLYSSDGRNLKRAGTFTTSTDGSGALYDSVGDPNTIGNRNGGDRTFNGEIALVCRWNVALSEKDLLTAIRTGPLSVRRNDMVLGWFGSADLGPLHLNPVARTSISVSPNSRKYPIKNIKPPHRNVYVIVAGGGDTTLIPSSIASGEAFGTAVVSSIASIIVTAIDSEEAFGSHTLSSVLNISPSAIASGEAFGSAILVPGAVSITPASIDSDEAFGSHIVTLGGVVIAPSAIPSGEAFGSATLVPGAVSISPSAIPSGEAFGSATLSVGTSFISPSAIPSGEAFGSATLVPGAVSILPTSIPSAESFGSAVVTSGTSFISPSAIPSGEAFGVTTLVPGTLTITVTGIASGEAFGVVIVTGGDVSSYNAGSVYRFYESSTYRWRD